MLKQQEREIDVKFYLDQRSERKGYMSGNDKVFAQTVRRWPQLDTSEVELIFFEDPWLQELRDAAIEELQAMLARPSEDQFLRDDYKEMAQLVLLVLNRFRDVDRPVADAALAVLRRHTAYLRPQTVVLSLASDVADPGQREALAAAVLSQPETAEPEDTELCLERDTQLADLATDASWLLFQLLKMDPRRWLKKPVSLWLRSPDITPPAAASSTDFRTERYHISELFEQL
ncbi:hypothetical protein FJT64_020479 [Amphibalanus amphitrite]|uniref:Uncharacterized protein n=1 Tax=Amphibalanus amphitrite TaxID=1232801 RepID=A0A6A4WWP6_AMPAM|nr:hypothetical protein FJT64_020479 [Amphibalanus amphitrite]